MLLTNTRLIELRTVADQCQNLIDRNQATILERDFVDLYNFVRDNVNLNKDCTEGQLPIVSLLFGK